MHGWHQNQWRIWELRLIKQITRRQTQQGCSPAEARASYTGEELASAVKGITSSGQIGLDACSEAQREFQALLAVYLFNAGQTGVPPEQTRMHTLTAYNLTVGAAARYLGVPGEETLLGQSSAELVTGGQGCGGVNES